MVSGSATFGGAAGCAAADASRPARKPASQERCGALAVSTTRLRSSISSSAKGAVFGIGEDCMDASNQNSRGHDVNYDIIRYFSVNNIITTQYLCGFVINKSGGLFMILKFQDFPVGKRVARPPPESPVRAS